MAIKIIGNLPPEDKEMVTVVFEQLMLEEVLPRLSGNYGYQIRSVAGEKKIARLFVLPKGAGIRYGQASINPEKG